MYIDEVKTNWIEAVGCEIKLAFVFFHEYSFCDSYAYIINQINYLNHKPYYRFLFFKEYCSWLSIFSQNEEK